MYIQIIVYVKTDNFFFHLFHTSLCCSNNNTVRNAYAVYCIGHIIVRVVIST